MELPAVDREPLRGKLAALRKALTRNRPLIAFSGGVDSTFLASAAKLLCADYLAATVRSPLCPSWESGESSRIAAQLGLNHRVIDLDLLSREKIAENPPDRCYHCKKAIFSELLGLAGREGYDSVLDGTNADEVDSHRPGRKALEELGISSPLAEVGLTKEEIRELSRMMALPTWNKEASPCLATRIPYGRGLQADRLSVIDRAESHIRDLGYRVVRVRDHGELARVELGEEELRRMDLESFRAGVVPRLRELGFRFVALDLQPYRSGPWDG